MFFFHLPPPLIASTATSHPRSPGLHSARVLHAKPTHDSHIVFGLPLRETRELTCWPVALDFPIACRTRLTAQATCANETSRSISTPMSKPGVCAPLLSSHTFTARPSYLTRGNQSDRTRMNADGMYRIENPLSGIPRRALLLAVDEFIRDKGLEEYKTVIRKGALVARDPTGYEDITGDEALDQKEIDALRDEVLHKWRVTNVLLLTVITCSIGAIVQGWDQTGANGATVEFPKAYHIGTESIRDKLLVGLVNAAPYIGTALFGCWLSEPINDRFGRRGTIFFSANFCLWPVLGSAFCNTWQELLACRLLLGIGMGTKASTSKNAFCRVVIGSFGKIY